MLHGIDSDVGVPNLEPNEMPQAHGLPEAEAH